jgi:hypothetical protein
VEGGKKWWNYFLIKKRCDKLLYENFRIITNVKREKVGLCKEGLKEHNGGPGRGEQNFFIESDENIQYINLMYLQKLKTTRQ